MLNVNKLLNNISEDTIHLLNNKHKYIVNSDDIDFNKDLINKIDLFLNSKDKEHKKIYEKDIKDMYNSPLFDKNMTKFFNNNWKYNFNYFLDYDETILNPVIKYIFESGDTRLIQLLIENGLSYIDKFMLCINPSLYSHSAIILKFNKPIKFDDSNYDVAGILYSFSIKAKTNNCKISFIDKLINRLRQLISLFWNKKGYMTRILLTSDDFSKLEKNNGNDVFKLSDVNGQLVKNSVNLSFNTLKTLNKVAEKTKENNIRMQKLTSNIEEISYFFSLYTKNNISYISTDKIVSYSFNNDDVELEIDSEKSGYSIYDFIWADHRKLKLTNEKKLSVIKEFVKIECLKLLKENKIIEENSNNFTFSDFDKLPAIKPNDLKRKFCYPETISFDLRYDLEGNLINDPVVVANLGYKMLSDLEQFNIEPECYSFLKNNCITTLKRVISNCSVKYKKILDHVDKELNIFQVRHPLSVFNKLKEFSLFSHFK